MPDTSDYIEVPGLQDILKYLPINPEDKEGKEGIVKYVQDLTNLITVNYKNKQYQFAYFGVHLLYMTFIYCTAWKIGLIEPIRYEDAFVFARSYNGREHDFKIENIDSIFVYSLMPEKDIAKLFKIIELDKSQISMVGNLVDARNEMAHASGKFEILIDKSYEAKVDNIISSMEEIHKCMTPHILNWYAQVLVRFCKGEYKDYKMPEDFIVEEMIQSFKFSTKELLICNEMSVSRLITEHRGYEAKLKAFKKTLTDHCQEMEYVT